MNEERFLAQRTSTWDRYAELTKQLEHNPKKSPAQEISEFVRLHRRVSQDLARVRTESSNAALIQRLNDLVIQGNGVLYRTRSVTGFQWVLHALRLSAQTFRRRFVFVAASMALFFFTAFLAAFLLRTIPETRDFYVSEEMAPLFSRWQQGRFDVQTGSESLAMTGFYASNNPRVSILMGAVGAGSFGLFSIYMIVMNGNLIGALASDMWSVNKLDFLITSILPHGIPELTGMFVSGAVGLMLGWALIAPGQRTRADALRHVGKDALVMLCTAVTLMFIAAPIEGFFSFNGSVPQWAKAVFAGVSLVFWIGFWSQFGREPEASAEANPS